MLRKEVLQGEKTLSGSVTLCGERVKNFGAAAERLSGEKKNRRCAAKRMLDPAGKGYSIRDQKDSYPETKRLLDAN